MRNVAIGQAGGPTAVINASLVGFAEQTLNSDVQLYGVLNGYSGLVDSNFIKFDGRTTDWVLQHLEVPGACLGSGRYILNSDGITQSIQNLKERDIHTLVFIGGNGTMSALKEISEVARSIGYELQVLGIPKTVDNDLGETDHAPGFGSAARYVAMSTRDISEDLKAMKCFEQVRILETMGRNSGWLAFASGALKNDEQQGPHLICVPEVPINQRDFLTNVDLIVKEYGFATIVVSEGATFNGDSQTNKCVVQGRAVLGGFCMELEELVKSQLGLDARSEILGMNQRSCSFAVSSQDYLEAYETGRVTYNYMMDGVTDVMISIQRADDLQYSFHLVPRPIDKVVAAGERLMTRDFILNPTEYYRWLRPLMGAGLRSYPSTLVRSIRNEESYSRS